MTTWGEMVTRGIVPVLILIGLATGAQGQPGSGTVPFGGELRDITQIKGHVVCVGCSLEEARKAGFLAMQFNLVVSTNEPAVRLWKKMGFAIVGTLPKAFRHPTLGLVDAFIMHRFL